MTIGNRKTASPFPGMMSQKGAAMKAFCAIALLVIALPASAQDARPLPPDSFQYDGRLPLRSFVPPSPVTIGAGPAQLSERPLPPDAIQNDDRRIQLRPFGRPLPEPKPEPKPEKAVG
jgi:hypothetical protein